VQNFLVLSWRSHPARQQPWRFTAGVGALVVVGLASLAFSGSTLVAATMVMVTWLSVHEFFVATEYRIDERGVTVLRPGRRHSHQSWQRVRRVVRERRGLLLSPHARANRWLDTRRGTYLRYAGNDEIVQSLVNCYLAAKNPEAER
jgi:hypothetical protein